MKYSKSELITVINQNNDDIEAYETKINELETLLAGVQTQTGPTTAISTMEDGTGRKTFNSFEDFIVFPTKLTYPTETQTSNDSYLAVTSQLTLKPSSNWLISMNGTEANLWHENGIAGKIMVTKVDEMLRNNDDIITESFEPFFAEWPGSEIKYNNIFIDADAKGKDAVTSTIIDEQPAQVRCGVIAAYNTVIKYMFIYTGEDSSVNNELILNLIQSMEFRKQAIRIDQ